MHQLGLVYSNQGDNEKAIDIWKRVNESYKGTPESKAALSAMREIYVAEDRVDEYFAYIQSIGEKPSVSQVDSTSYRAAENVYMNGDCDRSAPAFMEYINRFPGGAFSLNAHFYLADCEFRSSLFDKALANYDYVTKLPVSEFTESSWERMAYIYYHKKDDFSQALKAYQNLLKYAEYVKNIEKAKIGIMRSLWNMHDSTNVIAAAKNVAKIAGLKADVRTEAHMILAKSYLQVGQDSVALSYFDTIIKNSKSEASAEARYLKALYAYNAGNLDKSESIIFDIIQQDPSYEYWVAKALVLSADIFVKMDNKHQAIATLESIIEGYDGDQALIDEAKAKLKAIKDADQKKVENEKKDEDLIIDLNQDFENDELFQLEPEEIDEEEEF